MPGSRISSAAGRQYGNGKRFRERQDVGVTGDQRIGTASERQFQKRPVERIPAFRDHGRRVRYGDGFRSRAGSRRAGPIVRQPSNRTSDRPQRGSIRPRCPGLRVGEGGRSAKRHAATTEPPHETEAPTAPRSCPTPNRGLVMGPNASRRPRRTRLVSDRPSSASFARTPSARFTRTGVNTMRPFSVVTSKYSVASTAAVTALGRVS